MKIKRVLVGDVLVLRRRAVLVQPQMEYKEIGIRSFGHGIFHKESVSGASLGVKRVFQIEPGDLVISNVFAWEGAIALASEAEAGRIGSHRFMTFVPRDERIDSSWAAWFLRSETGLDLIGQASPGSAGRNRTLAIERFEALEIPLPPIGEQRRVAARLDRIANRSAELRALCSRVAALSDALRVSISARPDLDEATKARAGWRRSVLGEFLVPSTRQVSVDAADQYRIAGIYSFGRGLIDRGPISGADTSYKTLTVLEEGDVVVSKLGGWEGAVAVVEPRFRGFCVSSEFPTFTPDRSALAPAFFQGLARSPRFWQQVAAGTRGSMARRKRITTREFLATEAWLPPLADQQRVAKQISGIDEVSRSRLAASERLDALLPAALNEAFAGLS